jgi:hypothetical protein
MTSSRGPIKRSITTAERFGAWKAWNGRCCWCAEPVLFKNCQIDHIIPLSAVQSPSDRASIISKFSLAETFDFDSFGNWGAACAGCNGRKNALVIEAPNLIAILLTQVRHNSDLAKATAEKIEIDTKKAPLLAKITAAVSKGDVTESEIRDLLTGLPEIVQKRDADRFSLKKQEVLQIAPGWEVVRSDGHLLHVRTASGHFGITSTSRDLSWVCPTCGNKGPWDGIICRSCGSRHEPD